MNKKVTIECIDIKKSFINGDRSIEVLHDVDMTTYENEMIMLMGPSGSGKTTLISIIGGILAPTSGTCTTLGTSFHSLPEQKKIAFRGNNIGFMFQHFTLIPTISAEENVAIPLLCTGHQREESLEKARALLRSMGLEQQAHKTPNNLSGGEQQRTALARACIREPKIILCDEPTSFLDYERGKKIMTLLRDIKERNKSTIIVVTHDARILSFADRIIEIEDGRIKEKLITEHT